MNKIDPKNIPAKACTLSGGRFEFGDNGDNAKTRPVRLVARSHEFVDHWFWGKCVHDFSGMILSKDRIPIDYCHDDKDIIGYANKREVTDAGLILSGALVPWKDSDRATEVAFKAENGVPYEASIAFGGDGMKFEFVEEGQIATANGRDYEGPCIVFRQWPLRGVAICPHGADKHTAALFAAAETFTGEAIAATQETETMTTETQPEKVETVEATKPEVEGATTELSQPVETTAAEVEAEPGTEAPAEQPRTIDATEFAALVGEFGADIASRVVLADGGRAEALQFKAEALETRVKALEAENASLSQLSAGTPARRSDEPANKKKSIWSK